MPGTLATMLREKFPGAYDDVDDATLERAWIEKYPQDKDLTISEVSKDEPDTWMGGALKSVGETVGTTVGGAVRGTLGMLNPLSYLESTPPDVTFTDEEREYMRSGKVPDVSAGDVVASGVKAFGDPATGGAALGQLGTMLVAPRVAPWVAEKVPQISMPSLPGRGTVSGGLRGVGMASRAYGGMTGRIVGRLADIAADVVGTRPTAAPEAGAATSTVGGTTTGMQPMEPPPPPAAPYTPPTLDVQPPTLTMRGTLARPAGAPPGASGGSAPGGAPPPVRPTPPVAGAASAGAAAGGLSAAERATLVKQGFDEATIARIEAEAARQGGGSASPPATPPARRPTPPPVPPPTTPPMSAPVVEPPPPIPPVEPPAAPQATPAAVPTAELPPPPVVVPEPVAPSVLEQQLKATLAQRTRPAPPVTEPPPPVTEPTLPGDPLRNDIGAERIARQTGETIEEVRARLEGRGPETAPGQANPIIPDKAWRRIVQTRVEMVKKARAAGMSETGIKEMVDAWVNEAKDAKNWALIKSMSDAFWSQGMGWAMGTAAGGAMLRDKIRERLQEQ